MIVYVMHVRMQTEEIKHLKSLGVDLTSITFWRLLPSSGKLR